MHAVAREALASGEVLTPEGERLPLHSHLPRLECEVLQDWVVERRPRRLLEIGCAYGISTLFVCEALARTGGAEVYHVVDPWQGSEWRGVGIHALERAGYRHLVELHEVPSELFLPRLLAGGSKLDFALVDGWHGYDQVMMEVYYLNRLLDVGGLLVLDDVQLPAVRRVLDFLGTLPAYRPVPAPAARRAELAARVRRMMGTAEHRIAAVEKVAEDERSADFWVDFP